MNIPQNSIEHKFDNIKPIVELFGPQWAQVDLMNLASIEGRRAIVRDGDAAAIRTLTMAIGALVTKLLYPGHGYGWIGISPWRRLKSGMFTVGDFHRRFEEWERREMDYIYGLGPAGASYLRALFADCPAPRSTPQEHTPCVDVVVVGIPARQRALASSATTARRSVTQLCGVS